MESASSAGRERLRFRRRWAAVLILSGGLAGCGVRANPKPPLPEMHPPPPPAAAADAGR